MTATKSLFAVAVSIVALAGWLSPGMSGTAQARSPGTCCATPCPACANGCDGCPACAADCSSCCGTRAADGCANPGKTCCAGSEVSGCAAPAAPDCGSNCVGCALGCDTCPACAAGCGACCTGK